MNKEDYQVKLAEILGRCPYQEVAKEKLEKTLAMVNESGIEMTLVQQLTLTSHLCAMVERSQDGGEIPEVVPEMFSEVSALALGLAQQVCDLLPNLAIGEKYLLSIHFESARLNS